MEQQTKTLRDYVAVLRRRRMQFATVAGTLLVTVLAVAWWLPPVYRSTATILIEQQEIPSDLVRSTISSYADQRIQVISQQAMSRASLMQIVEKYGLYGADKGGKGSAEKVERLRKNINLELVKADVTDQRNGNRTTATIAFTLSYDGETAEVTQKVANELVALFLNANLKERRQQAAETSTFFEGEADKLSKRISEAESRMAAFKARNMGRLPEQVQLNLQERDRAESEIKEVDRQVNALEGRKFYLEGQVAQIKPNGPMVSATGERILDEAERLKILQTRYAGLSGVYSSDHPDMIKMRREIDALQKEAGAGADNDEQAKQLTRLRADLTMARDKYSDDHPDVIRLRKSIAALEGAVAQPSPDGARLRDTRPENPAYIALQSQLDATNSELKSLRSKRIELKSSILALESRLAQAPQVEREYLDLARDHENSLRRYEEIKAKQMQAQIAQQLERDSKGERFSLLDPAQLPERPHSPNRLAIVFLGLLLSVGGGAAYAGVRESLDDSIYGSATLAAVSKAPLLALIPYIEDGREEGKKRRARTIVAASLLALLAAGLVLVLSSRTEPHPDVQPRSFASSGATE
jgi:succinoglycan biosynthesis transport protein ExoP